MSVSTFNNHDFCPQSCAKDDMDLQMSNTIFFLYYYITMADSHKNKQLTSSTLPYNVWTGRMVRQYQFNTRDTRLGISETTCRRWKVSSWWKKEMSNWANLASRDLDMPHRLIQQVAPSLRDWLQQSYSKGAWTERLVANCLVHERTAARKGFILCRLWTSTKYVSSKTQ